MDDSWGMGGCYFQANKIAYEDIRRTYKTQHIYYLVSNFVDM